MSISSVSLTYFSLVSAPASAAAPSAASGSAAESSAACERRSHGRRNVLYDAMLSALRDLGLTQQPSRAPAASNSAASPATAASQAAPPSAAAGTPAAATGSPSATVTHDASAAQPATAPPPSLEEAVSRFAHALMQALRGGRDSGSRHDRGQGDDDEHRSHHRHHGRGHGYGMARDYSGLASRLEALAVRMDAPASASGVGSAAAAATTGPASEAVPLEAAPAALSAGEATSPTPANPVPTPIYVAQPRSTHSLSDAFAAMIKVLRGADPASAAEGATESNLSAFLHSLARGLDSDRSQPQMTTLGVMINISA